MSFYYYFFDLLNREFFFTNLKCTDGIPGKNELNRPSRICLQFIFCLNSMNWKEGNAHRKSVRKICQVK